MNNNKIISSYSFASISDVIFTGFFMKSQVEDLKLRNNIQQYFGPSEYTFVRQKEFTLRENDVIFCKTEHIFELFYLLNKFCNFENIKLITHQSDMNIDNRIYRLKPKCISKWYSINVNTQKEDLIPIPIGIANFHSKNLSLDMFDKNNFSEEIFSNDKKLLYLNFNQNTNFNHRKGLFKLFNSTPNTTVRIENISNKNYFRELQDHSFTLAPWGNGIDTHRFWEALYSGSIPITKNHVNFKSFKSFPYILVDDYKMINHQFLNNELNKIKKNKKNFNFDELDIKYWENKIRGSDNNKLNGSIYIFHDKFEYFKKKERLKYLIKIKFKKFNRYRRAFYKIFKI